MGSDLINVSNSNSKSSFPPGFRFHPTDEELVLYYLKRKICRRSLKLDIIAEVDVYKWDPHDLPGQSKLKSGDRQWFFFSPRDRKYPNGGRSSRATMNGYWKATGKDRIIKRKSSSAGIKKTLVYYHGRAPSGKRTDWVMHEYSLDEEELRRCPDIQKEHYVLYKIFKKSGPGPKNGEQYGAPFVEEEWSDDDCFDHNNFNPILPSNVNVNEFKQNAENEPVFSSDILEFLNKIVDEPDILPPIPQLQTSPQGQMPLVVGEDFLEMDDLIGPQPSEFPDLDSFDLYHDSAVYGNQELQLQADYVEYGTENCSQVTVNHHHYHEEDVSYDLWDHESSIITTDVSQPQPLSGEENQNLPPVGGNENNDSWFTSALWSFVESIPTTPASASESSALMNRAFERMSSFSKIKVAATNSSSNSLISSSSSSISSKRLEKKASSSSSSSNSNSNRGIIYFSVLGVLFAILVGTSMELLGRW